MYATYEGVIRASGADLIPVPLRPENGFRISADDIAARITPKTSAILLTTPHNPSGSVLTRADIDTKGRLAIKHDFWINSDEVYEKLICDGAEFTSPFPVDELQFGETQKITGMIDTFCRALFGNFVIRAQEGWQAQGL
jgi:arginine:pyruvate transaminase